MSSRNKNVILTTTNFEEYKKIQGQNMKKLVIIILVIVAGLYMLGDWATDPASIDNQTKKLGEITR